MASLADLERVGSLVAGDSLDPNPQTAGGLTDLVFTRNFKVNSAVVGDYLYRILDPIVVVMDLEITNAYLVAQRATKIDDVNMNLACVFAQIPSMWTSDSAYETVTFPGVAPSALFAPGEFDFRTGAASYNTLVRRQHDYFLGPLKAIPTIPRFRPVDVQTGLRVSQITDYTFPSSDEYISMVGGRREIVVDSVPQRWKGNIFNRVTRFAQAK